MHKRETSNVNLEVSLCLSIVNSKQLHAKRTSLNIQEIDMFNIIHIVTQKLRKAAI